MLLYRHYKNQNHLQVQTSPIHHLPTVSNLEGCIEGKLIGDEDGESLALVEGTSLGYEVGNLEGCVEGKLLGNEDGESLGLIEGKSLGCEER
mmetsp:Transcript_11776/g.13696  ORF Transcript_11776/g.13696 Transcript_11776/m.13696 type:complete len:92 (-) Transcript_11776:17-292(-)